MSTQHGGWETWIRFGSQSAQGTAATAWHTYDTDAGDSLAMNEAPIDRVGITGNRTRHESSYRKGHYLPGGGLGAYPFAMGTDSNPLLLLLDNHFQNYSFGTGGGTAPCTYTFTPSASQIDTGSYQYLTFQKDTGIAGAGEQYLDCITEELTGNWAVDAQYYTITPTIKALSGGTTSTITGDGTAVGLGFYTTDTISFTWNGTTIYPTSFSWTGKNNTPEGQAASVRGRKFHSIGNYTGNASLNMSRDDDFDLWFIDEFGHGTAGTLVMSGTLATTYGTLLDGNPIHFDHTFYLDVNPPTQPTGQGEIVDSVEFLLLSHSLVMPSDLDSI